MVYIALGAEIYRLHHLFDQFDVAVAITILIWLLLQKFHSRKKKQNEI